ncbi:MAG: hypothetical protein JNL83_07765 [Myxococcales bacterium]|nr:hypothetical protein [Myxococcales bacterium]
MRLRVLVLVVTTACGRVAFDAARDAAPDDGGPDADAPMMTIDAPPSLCGTAGGLVCDGFEGTVLDPRWQLDLEQGTVALSTVRAYRGGSSIRAQTDPITTMTTYPRALLLAYDGLPITGTLHARVFVYLPTPASTMFDQLFNFADGSGQGVSMGIRDGVVVNNDYSSTQYRESATAFPLNRWTCLQMEIPADTTGTIRIFIDGTELADAAIATGATPHPRPTHLYLGIDWPSIVTSLPPSEAWFDELLFDSSPITCAQ